jgi:hypothetical protein
MALARSRSILIGLLVLAPLSCVARAGDCPIFGVGDWGVGKIDGRVMFYLGKGRYLDTPIPAPPEGPRWDVGYRMMPGLAAGCVVCVVGSVRRRRRA